jgi:hypothetical protein
MAQRNLNKIYPQIDGGTANKYGLGKLAFIPTDTEPTATEGVIYFDDSENKFKMCTDGSTWTAISAANAATTGLDGAYDLNNGITVDGSPVTLTHTGTTYDGMQITSAVVTADDKALLDLVWTGTPHAGSNLLRLDGSGMTTTNTPYLMEVAADAKDVGAIYIDSDAATDHQIYVLDAGDLGAGKAQLYLDNDGTPNATATMLTLDGTGITATNTPVAMLIDTHGKDYAALTIDSDAATDDVISITNGGALANNKAIIDVVWDGTPANAGANMLRLDATGVTATNKPVLMEILGSGKTVKALEIDADIADNNVVSINGGGNLADGYAILALTADGASQSAGGCLLSLNNSGTPDTDSRAIEIVGDGVDMRAIYIDMDAATNDGVYILNQGNIAAGKAAVHIDIDGTPNATGNALLVEGTGATMSGTPNLVKFDTSTKDATALYIDSDSATDGCVIINSGGNLADNKAVLELKWDGTPAAAGTNMLRVDGSGGTNTAKPVLVEIYDDSVAVGLSVSTASIEDMVTFIGTGATGANKAVLDITSTAVMNAAGNLLRLDLTGADCTSVPTALEIVGAGETARGIYVDTDGTTVGAAKFHSGGALTDGVAVVNITNDGNLATGGNLLNVTMGGTPHAAAAAVEIVASKDAKALDITTSAATNSAVKITGVGAVANDMALLHVSHGTGAIVAGGSIVRIEGNANAGGATAYGMTINCDGTNLEGLWVEAGTVLIAEQLTATGGVVTKLGTTANLTDTTPTSAEFDTAFGVANKTKGGFIGVVEDSGSGVAYLVFSDGTTWHFCTGTGAAA